MADFVHRTNIARFKDLLRRTHEPKEKALLEELLAAEQQKLGRILEKRDPN